MVQFTAERRDGSDALCPCVWAPGRAARERGDSNPQGQAARRFYAFLHEGELTLHTSQCATDELSRRQIPTTHPVIIDSVAELKRK